MTDLQFDANIARYIVGLEQSIRDAEDAAHALGYPMATWYLADIIKDQGAKIAELKAASVAASDLPPAPKPTLNYPTLRYTTERDTPCAACSGIILSGAQCYRDLAPDTWRHLAHGPLLDLPPAETKTEQSMSVKIAACGCMLYPDGVLLRASCQAHLMALESIRQAQCAVQGSLSTAEHPAASSPLPAPPRDEHARVREVWERCAAWTLKDDPKRLIDWIQDVLEPFMKPLSASPLPAAQTEERIKGEVMADNNTNDFAKGLESLLNRYSQENASNTPDFILTQYLLACLSAWNDSVRAREKWYSREADTCAALSPSQPSAPSSKVE